MGGTRGRRSALLSVSAVELRFAAGTLELRGTLPTGWPRATASWARAVAAFVPPRWRMPNCCGLLTGGRAYEDKARAYEELERGLSVQREPRRFQTEALKAWREAKGRGVVGLATGAGKSHVALLAIDDKRRSALVVAPTSIWCASGTIFYARASPVTWASWAAARTS